MNLGKTIIRGKKIKPINVLLHGTHGIGKSTWPSKAPNPIYIGSEENDELDVARFPKIEKWEDLEKQLDYLVTSKHEFKTVVIDTIDSLEQIASKIILSGKNADKNMNTAMGGYGAGNKELAKMFQRIRDNYLIPLRDVKKMNIVLLAHTEKVKFEDPITVTSSDKYETAIQNRVKSIFEDWVSTILFVNYELVRAESSSGKEYAEGDGERVVYTQERPSHVAKNRFNLPEELPLDWTVFASGVKKFYKDVKEGKIKEKSEETSHADELLKKLPEEMQEKFKVSIARAKGSEAELNKIIKRMEVLLK